MSNIKKGNETVVVEDSNLYELLSLIPNSARTACRIKLDALSFADK
jgi:hypothetical protein